MMLRNLKRFKEFNKFFFRIFISVGLFIVVLLSVDTAELWESFSLLDWRYLPLIFLFIILNYLVSSYRWKVLLIFKNTSHISVKYLAGLYFIGAFFNNFMPSGIGGDLFKMYRLGEKINNKTYAFVATFFERFTGFIVLLFISYFGLILTRSLWIKLIPGFIVNSTTYTFMLDFVVFTGFWWVSLIGFLVLYFLAKKFQKFTRVYDALKTYLFNKKVLGLAFLTSLVVQVLTILSQLIILYAMGVSVPLLYALAVFPVIILASSLIPSLNGMGVQDVLYIELLGIIGVVAPLALSASIIYHICRLLVSLIGGAIYAFESRS